MSSTFEKMNNVMKKVWLGIFLISFVIVVIMVFIDGWDRWMYYFVFPGLALLMYLFRRFAGGKVAATIERDKQNANQQK